MAGSGAFRRLPATSTRLASSVAGELLPRLRVPPPLADLPVRGVGDHQVDRPGGKPRDVVPEIAQDRGEPTPEPVLPDVPAGGDPPHGQGFPPPPLPPANTPPLTGKE